MVRSFARKYAGSDVEYEDLMQDGFVAVIECLDRHDGRPSFGAYAHSRIRGAMLDALRRRRRQARDRQEPRPLPEPRGEDGSADELLAGGAADGLGGSTRYVVRRMCLDGRTAVQVGRELGIRPVAVRRILAEGLSWMRERMAACA